MSVAGPSTEVWQGRAVRLVRRPQGRPVVDDFSWDVETVGPLEEGQVLVAVSDVSIDPAMRGWMTAAKSYIPAVELGQVMRAAGAGVVRESRHAGFSPGDLAVGLLGLRELAVVHGGSLIRSAPSLGVPSEVLVGGLGGTGLTAYFGLTDVGAVRSGETVLVSAAAGAVGSVVGQVAKILGCRAVGLAGGPEKCRHVVEDLGFDACIDYKARAEDLVAAVHEACPDRVDVYFDNVGGAPLEAALAPLSHGARIVLCGAVSQYNADHQGWHGPRNYMNLLVRRASMRGFVLFDYADRYAEGALQLAGWWAEGRLKFHHPFVEGLDAYVDALNRLWDGDKLGKLVLRIG